MSVYTTAAGRTVTTGARVNAFNQTAHIVECNGCDGIRGFTTFDAADDHARKHADKCSATGTQTGTR